MSRAARFELVRSDAGFFARFIAYNGREIWRTSEVYTRRQGAKKAVELVANSFTLTGARFTFRRDDLYIYAQGVGIEVREIDERTP
jgi:uncharacterized protein YegP (UPF0339 family)